MKKKFMLVIAVIMVLGSIRAMAMTEQEAMDMNTLTKIDAIEGSFSGECHECNHEDGRIMAVQMDSIKILKDRVDTLVNIAGDEGVLQQSSLGQMSFLADMYVTEAEQARSSDALNKVYESSLELEKEVRKIEKQLGR